MSPMSFPDMDSLIMAAEVHKYRKPYPAEKEEQYRALLANHVESIDMIEAHEIRTGKGHDEWNKQEARQLLRRSGFGFIED